MSAAVIARETWATRVRGPGAVVHGAATLLMDFEQGEDRRWRHVRSRWARAA